MHGALWEQRLDETAEVLRAQAVGRVPDRERLLEARRQRVWALWMLGRLEACFAEYRELAALEGRAADGQPRAWDGAPLAGRRLQVQACDGGFGDLIQWARFLLPLSGRAPAIDVMARPELARLFAHSFGPGFRCEPRDSQSPPADIAADLKRLPFLLELDHRELAARVPYLRAPAEEVQRWRARLHGLPRPWIGVCWTGARPGEAPDPRSVPLRLLAPVLAARRATFVSLLQGRRSEEVEGSGLRGRLLEPAERFADFADAAGLMASLDLVVTCDTAAAHLAGALGRPAFLLLNGEPFEGWWLGLPEEGRTLWYPSLRLLRQARAGDWSAPLEALSLELASFCAGA